MTLDEAAEEVGNEGEVTIVQEEDDAFDFEAEGNDLFKIIHKCKYVIQV